jgi:thymidylate synthase
MFRKELSQLSPAESCSGNLVPVALVLAHFAFLAGVVVFAHHQGMFMGLFIFFLGVTHAYQRHQDRLTLREVY